MKLKLLHRIVINQKVYCQCSSLLVPIIQTDVMSFFTNKDPLKYLVG